MRRCGRFFRLRINVRVPKLSFLHFTGRLRSRVGGLRSLLLTLASLAHWRLRSLPIARYCSLTIAGSRYIYDLYYTRSAISKPLYDYLLKHNYADAALIAKWKKQGYEHLCCLRCIQTKETNFNSTCICRVPRAQLKDGQAGECVSCGCRGCASSD